jgi:DNA-binding response OmpR family regulator
MIVTRILIIDDEAPVRAFVRQTLEEEGYQISEAADGEEGLAALRTLPADLIITDIFMPNKEGIETICAVRRHFPSVKILAISGGGNYRIDMLPAAMHLGAHHALTKPFTPDELLAAVNVALTRKYLFSFSQD